MTAAPVLGSLNASQRERDLAALAGRGPVDVLVVGGGVTGCGVALDAASRGLSVLLVEAVDLAFGTSRWSSKLVHGGLRYLAHGDVGVAWESARERGILMERTAPHLVHALPMLVPFPADLARSQRAVLRAGYLAGDAMRRAARTSSATLPRPRRVSRAEARRWVPSLRADVVGGVLGWDGQVEDDARLVVALARTAAAHGASILTRTRAVELHGTGGVLRDEVGGGTVEVRAGHVVNATGVWAGAVSAGVQVRPSRGAHLVLRAATLGHPAAAVTLPVPGERGRFVFALPQPDDLVFVGITDVPQEEVTDVPQASAAEIDFLVATLAAALDRPVTRDDVVGTYAGLRPLLAGDADNRSSADLSRRHAVVTGPDGVLTVTGGKLTTYRQMAADAVDRITDRPCRTAWLPLVGVAAPRPGRDPAGLVGRLGAARLVRRYGVEATGVAELAADDPDLALPLHPALPVLGVEVAWAVRHEGAAAVDDLLERRTRLSLVPVDAELAAPAVERILAQTSEQLARIG